MTSEDDRDWDAAATRLGQRAVEDGEPTRWYDEVWSSAERDEIDMPWERDDAYPPLVDLLDAGDLPAPGRAVVVGAGRGADAEELARRGWDTTAFDISPAAVRLASAKHAGSPVEYRVADLLDLPEDLVGAFDLVVEIFTVQALARSLRDRAVAGVRQLLAPGGHALVVQFEDWPGRPEGPPWLLTRAEMESFAADDVELLSLDHAPHPLRPDGPPIWRALLRRRA